MKRKILILLVLVLMISISFALVDNLRIRMEQDPIFAFPLYQLKDGGTIEYYGLGYKIIDYNTIEGKNEYAFGTWLMPSEYR